MLFSNLAPDKELFIVAANIATRKKHVYSAANTDVSEAIANSCAIPLVFRGANELGANPYVDGGLCENLPSEELSKDVEQYGEVIAISFPNYVDGVAPSNTIAFVYELFSTAINNSVERAAAQLRQHTLLSIDSDSALLDFAGAFDAKRRKDAFKVVRYETTEWLKRNIAYKPEPISPPPVIVGRNEAAESLMADIYDWYLASQAMAPRRSIRSVLAVIAHSLHPEAPDPKKAPDVLEKWYYFAPISVPMVCFMVTIGGSEQQVLFNLKQRVEVWDPEGNQLKARVLPAIDRSARGIGPYQGFLILFEPVLPPMSEAELSKRGPYVARYVTEIPGGMAGLLDGRDELVNANARPETYEMVEIVLYTPVSFQYDAKATLTRNGVKTHDCDMVVADLRSYEERSLLDFSVRGWKAVKFVQGSELRVDLKLK